MPGQYQSNGQQYATTTDLASVVASQALAHPSTDTTAQNAALLRASEEIDTFLRDQFTLPLVTWGSDIVQKCCDIAAYRLMCKRGFNPQDDSLYLDNYKLAIDWLKMVAAGKVTPDVVDASAGAAPGLPTPSAQPVAVTSAPVNSTGGSTRGTSSR